MIHLKNETIEKVLVAVPSGHRHIRAYIKTSSGEEVLLNEATLAGIVRAYIGIKTHPLKTAIELNRLVTDDGKKGFAATQLVETSCDEEDVSRTVAGLVEKIRHGKEFK